MTAKTQVIEEKWKDAYERARLQSTPNSQRIVEELQMLKPELIDCEMTKKNNEVIQMHNTSPINEKETDQATRSVSKPMNNNPLMV